MYSNFQEILGAVSSFDHMYDKGNLQESFSLNHSKNKIDFLHSFPLEAGSLCARSKCGGRNCAQLIPTSDDRDPAHYGSKLSSRDLHAL